MFWFPIDERYLISLLARNDNDADGDDVDDGDDDDDDDPDVLVAGIVDLQWKFVTEVLWSLFPTYLLIT